MIGFYSIVHSTRRRKKSENPTEKPETYNEKSLCHCGPEPIAPQWPRTESIRLLTCTILATFGFVLTTILHTHVRRVPATRRFKSFVANSTPAGHTSTYEVINSCDCHIVECICRWSGRALCSHILGSLSLDVFR